LQEQKIKMTTEIAQQQQHDANAHHHQKTTSTTEQNHHGLLSPLDDANVKFPLQDSWSFHFYKNEKTKSWKENVKFITTVDFVEDFWGVYNHLQLVSKLSPGCDFMLFKKDIPPMWEDVQNRDGGRWVLSLDKKNRFNSLDIYWLNSLLALVGDQFFDQSSYINGVWVNVRAKGDKLALWTKDAKDAETQMKIGRRFKEILNLKDSTLQYEEHDETNKKGFLYEC
jgi:translation initiation factor 4E